MPYKDPKKQRDAGAKYRKKHHDAILKKQREFSKKNPDYQKKLRAKDGERIRQRDRDAYKRNSKPKKKSNVKSRKKHGSKWNKTKRDRYAEDEEYRQKILDAAVIWRKNNPDWISAYNKNYAKENKVIKQEYMKVYGKIYYQRNILKIKKQKADYHKKKPEIQLKAHLKHLEKLAMPFELTSREYKRCLTAWSRVIKKRDKVCQHCGSNKKTQAHHMIYRANYPLLSFSEDNGILLCDSCHFEAHGKKLV